ncbi:MAG TPA: xanthine dehydrogenase family protein molybdopterin-binding subunit [Steroidobacteraceae bacterium]|nr:xanthine dehydrogenase family protein molybdopterin-binding subunit [Steroidobacteraceae bacterium]
MSAVSRRRFIATSAGASAGLVLAFHVPLVGRLARAAEPAQPKAALPPLNAFLEVGADDTVTVRLAHSEMGQGIWTTLAMFVAEELDCNWSQMRIEHAPAAPVYAHPAFGIQMTGGSSTTWSEFDRYRQVGAMARDMLVRAAAAEWQVSPADCHTENGAVVSGTKRTTYGALAGKAAKLSPPAEVTLKPAKEWKIIGKPTKRLDSPEKVTGRAQFGLDVRFPGLMTAVVARAPVFGAQVKSFDPAKAKAVPGVKAVVQVPSGVAVVAENFWAAKTGRDALEVQWELGPGAKVDTDRQREEFRDLSRTPGAVAAEAGEVAAEAGPATLEAEFDFPYLAHAPMEPLNCTARVSDGACEVWLGTQFQTLDQQVAAEVAGLKPEQVKVHTTFLGGAFGRRATGSAHVVREAVATAKASGMPVKVVWTREDDMHGGYYRPQWLHRVAIHTGTDGLPRRWDHTIVGQSIIKGTLFEGGLIKNGIDATSVEGVADSPYVKRAPVHRVALHSPELPVTTLWWRSVGHSHNAFVMESLVDELAHAAKQDPLDYRRRLLAQHPRHLGVLNLVAEKAGWGKPLSKGRARGLAVHESFGSWVAQVAEVSLEGDQLRVHRVVCAVDCGICVNPEGVRAQMESGIVYGLSAALFGRITLKEGRVQQSNFHDYRVVRINEAPAIEVHIVPSSEKSGGAGEPGTPPIAPAVGNALFVLTNRRMRSLPFNLSAAS